MGESKDRQLSEIEQRAALKARQQARTSPRILDQFARPLQIGDGILLAQTEPMAIVWRVRQMGPAPEPAHAGMAWVEVATITKVLMPMGMPTPGVVLGMLAPEAQGEAEHNGAGPAPGKTASGIILSDPDGMSDR